jgi:beta-lactam-binding protein with PASTA domain
VDAAKSTLSARGLQCKIHGKGETILGQTPASGTVLAPGTVITLATSDGNGLPQAGYTIVPDLRGLSLRRALNSLVTSQLDVSINGSGVVAAQNPAAGQSVRIGTRVTVRCEPRNFAAG